MEEKTCCSEEKESTCCGEEKDCGSHSEEMMELAHQAWEDLMMDKMKVHYEAQKGESMDKVAKISVEACSEFWKHKIAGNEEGINAVMTKLEEDLNKTFKE